MRKILYIVCLSSLWSCKKDKTTSVDLGYDYFPIQVGSQWLYKVDSMVYYSGNDTLFTYNEQIIVDSTFIDDVQDTVFRLLRYKNSVINKVYTIKKLPSRLEQRENNIEVKLIFPIREGQTWNINSFSALDPTEVYCENVGKAFSKDTLTYDTTCSVILEDIEVRVDVISSLEVYAKNQGLIFLEQKNYKINQSIKEGFMLTKRLKQYTP